MKKFDKKIILIILLIVFLFTISFFFFKLNSNETTTNNIYDKYSQKIYIEYIDEKDEKRFYSIFLEDDGYIAKAETNFLENPIYMNDFDTIFYEDGRYKKIKGYQSYRNLKKLLKKIDVKESELHPIISKNTINEIFRSLHIPYEIEKDVPSNIEINNNFIKEFSIYLRDFKGYKKFNISISISELEKNYKIKSPIFYDEITDEVDNSKLILFNN